jgi:hypothetical protein
MSALAMGCPGGEVCARTTRETIRAADGELLRRRIVGRPPEEWATTTEEMGGYDPEAKNEEES